MKKNSGMMLLIIAVLLLGSFVIYQNPEILKGIGLGSASIVQNVYGMSIESVSKDWINVSNDSEFSNYNWIVKGVLNGGSQSIVAGFGKIASPDGLFESKFPLEFKSEGINELLLYKTQGAIQNLYSFSVVKYEGLFWEDLESKCTQQYPNRFKYFEESSNIIGKVGYCVVPKLIGITSQLNNPDVVFDAKITLNANGVSITKQFSNSDSSVTFSKDGVTYATLSWVGNYVTGSSPPSGSTYSGVYDDSKKQWHVIDHLKVTNYQSTYNATIQALNTIGRDLTTFNTGISISPLLGVSITPINRCAVDSRNCLDFFNAIIQKNNEASSEILTTQSKIGGYDYTVVNPQNQSSLFQVSIPTRIQNPAFTLFLKADWIGVKTLSGKATISNVSCPEISSDLGNAVITTSISVTQAGSFFTTANCPNFIQTNSNQNFFNFGSGSLISYLNTNQKIGVENCSVVLKNNLGNILDTKSVSCNVTIPRECTSGDVKATGLSVYDCVNGKWVLRFTCGNNQELSFENGQYVCKDLSPPPLLCGNGIVDFGEQCDGTNMNSKSCSDFKYASGSLKCTSSCNFDFSGCVNKVENCSDIPADGWFVLTYVEQTVESPQYLLWFIPAGTVTSTSCQPVYNNGLILLIIIVLVVFLFALFLVTKGKGKRIIRKRRK